MGRSLFEQIREWKLEAKSEDTDRYFYHTNEVHFIENGSRCYVIGRKGTGKTAISEHLNKDDTYKRFSQKLTFKNFPFNELYDLKNDKYTAPNQYITIWKYIIYTSIAKMMIKNNNINGKLRRKLKEVYSNDPVRSLSRTISRWTSGSFSLSVLGSGGALEGSRSTDKNNVSWLDRVEILEEIIERNIDEASYYVIFDELDEDYKDITSPGRYGEYISLLTGLFKAVQDVKSIFPSRDYHIYPVIFLRDDIFEIMQDTDKAKWYDSIIELEWNPDKIKNLLAFRISRAINADGPTLDFNTAWHHLFSGQGIRYGKDQRKTTNSFDYITRSTQLRPRDYIRYIQACAESALARGDSIVLPHVIKHIDNTFSNYLRTEIEGEMHSMIPEIKQILDVVAHIRKNQFNFNEFTIQYQKAIEEEQITARSPESVLKALFLFSVIGNQPSQKNIQVFRYQNKDARLNLNEDMCVHRGLLKALQIY
jgi:hypothetical protein